MSEPVISARALSRRFGETTVVRDVSFDVDRGAIFGLLGPNGAGKSTIIRMLCGVLRPSAGSAQILGVDVTADPEAIKRRIGYMSQKFSLYSDLSAAENLRFYSRIYGLTPARQKEREEAVVSLTGLAPYLNHLGRHLSGGWKQRLALACALVHEPEVLFLDEPTAGIDPVARRDLWDLLFALSHRGVTMLVTTHYMDEAERCSHVGYIQQAQLIAVGRPDELKQSPDVTPPGTVRYELTCASPADALARSYLDAGVQDATLFGNSLHVLVRAELAPECILELICPGDATGRLRPIGPTLEDVFVILSRLHQKRSAA